MYMVEHKQIVVTVDGPFKDKSLKLTLNWDADLSDWETAFKTILMHMTFPERSIEEFFDPGVDEPVCTEFGSEEIGNWPSWPGDKEL